MFRLLTICKEESESNALQVAFISVSSSNILNKSNQFASFSVHLIPWLTKKFQLTNSAYFK